MATVAKLRAYAKKSGIRGYSKMSKAQLESAIGKTPSGKVWLEYEARKAATTRKKPQQQRKAARPAQAPRDAAGGGGRVERVQRAEKILKDVMRQTQGDTRTKLAAAWEKLNEWGRKAQEKGDAEAVSVAAELRSRIRKAAQQQGLMDKGQAEPTPEAQTRKEAGQQPRPKDPGLGRVEKLREAWRALDAQEAYLKAEPEGPGVAQALEKVRQRKARLMDVVERLGLRENPQAVKEAREDVARAQAEGKARRAAEQKAGQAQYVPGKEKTTWTAEEAEARRKAFESRGKEDTGAVKTPPAAMGERAMPTGAQEFLQEKAGRRTGALRMVGSKVTRQSQPGSVDALKAFLRDDRLKATGVQGQRMTKILREWVKHPEPWGQNGKKWLYEQLRINGLGGREALKVRALLQEYAPAAGVIRQAPDDERYRYPQEQSGAYRPKNTPADTNETVEFEQGLPRRELTKEQKRAIGTKIYSRALEPLGGDPVLIRMFKGKWGKAAEQIYDRGAYQKVPVWGKDKDGNKKIVGWKGTRRREVVTGPDGKQRVQTVEDTSVKVRRVQDYSEFATDTTPEDWSKEAFKKFKTMVAEQGWGGTDEQLARVWDAAKIRRDARDELMGGTSGGRFQQKKIPAGSEGGEGRVVGVWRGSRDSGTRGLRGPDQSRNPMAESLEGDYNSNMPETEQDRLAWIQAEKKMVRDAVANDPYEKAQAELAKEDARVAMEMERVAGRLKGGKWQPDPAAQAARLRGEVPSDVNQSNRQKSRKEEMESGDEWGAERARTRRELTQMNRGGRPGMEKRQGGMGTDPGVYPQQTAERYETLRSEMQKLWGGLDDGKKRKLLDMLNERVFREQSRQGSMEGLSYYPKEGVEVKGPQAASLLDDLVDLGVEKGWIADPSIRGAGDMSKAMLVSIKGLYDAPEDLVRNRTIPVLEKQIREAGLKGQLVVKSGGLDYENNPRATVWYVPGEGEAPETFQQFMEAKGKGKGKGARAWALEDPTPEVETMLGNMGFERPGAAKPKAGETAAVGADPAETAVRREKEDAVPGLFSGATQQSADNIKKLLQLARRKRLTAEQLETLKKGVATYEAKGWQVPELVRNKIADHEARLAGQPVGDLPHHQRTTAAQATGAPRAAGLAGGAMGAVAPRPQPQAPAPGPVSEQMAAGLAGQAQAEAQQMVASQPQVPAAPAPTPAPAGGMPNLPGGAAPGPSVAGAPPAAAAAAAARKFGGGKMLGAAAIAAGVYGLYKMLAGRGQRGEDTEDQRVLAPMMMQMQQAQQPTADDYIAQALLGDAQAMRQAQMQAWGGGAPAMSMQDQLLRQRLMMNQLRMAQMQQQLTPSETMFGG